MRLWSSRRSPSSGSPSSIVAGHVLTVWPLQVCCHSTVAAVPVEAFIVTFFVGSLVGAIGYVAMREVIRRRRKGRAASAPPPAAQWDVLVDADEVEDGDVCGELDARESLRSSAGRARLLQPAYGLGETPSVVDEYGKLSSRVSVRLAAQSGASHRERGSGGVKAACQRSSEMQMVEMGITAGSTAAASAASPDKAPPRNKQISARQAAETDKHRRHTLKLHHSAL